MGQRALARARRARNVAVAGRCCRRCAPSPFAPFHRAFARARTRARARASLLVVAIVIVERARDAKNARERVLKTEK